MTDDRRLLEVTDLQTHFETADGTVHAVKGASFTVEQGEIVGIVGESGSGKSVTALSCIRLEEPGEIVSGSIRFRGTDVTTADERRLRRMRGQGMAMVFQDPTTTLNPVFRVSEQIAEALKVHEDPDSQRLLDYLHVRPFSNRSDWTDKRRRAVDLMDEVGIPNPEERVDAYPHEFSGGMRQRAMLAIALAREPGLLIADEPTTALDVTIQAQLLERIRQLNQNFGMAVLLITHDLGVVAEVCDRVIVLYDGEVMERGSVDRMLVDPRHPYTRGLLECLPQTTPRQSRLSSIDGDVPDQIGPGSGCPFAPRCEYAVEECRTGEMPRVPLEDGREAKCCRPAVLDADPTEVE